jgi:CrcB protein
MREPWLVGAGGFIGSILRYGLSGAAQQISGSTTFPYGTLAVNVCGCVAIGVAGGLIDARQLFGPEVRVFLLIGVLGGFTTFSTFGYETIALVRDGDLALAASSVLLHLVRAVGGTWLGYGLAVLR